MKLWIECKPKTVRVNILYVLVTCCHEFNLKLNLDYFNLNIEIKLHLIYFNIILKWSTVLIFQQMYVYTALAYTYYGY